MSKILINLKSTFYDDEEIQDIMIEFYLTKKKSYEFFLQEQFHFHLFELEHLIELEHLPEHLIWVLFGGNTMT